MDWATSLKIVDGYGDGRFGPNDPVTREQLAATLYRYGKVKEIDFTGSGDQPLDFLDAGELSGWAREPMCWMVENGVINGKGGKRLDPAGKAVRAQSATMLQRFCEAVEIS